MVWNKTGFQCLVFPVINATMDEFYFNHIQEIERIPTKELILQDREQRSGNIVTTKGSLSKYWKSFCTELGIFAKLHLPSTLSMYVTQNLMTLS
jgi:hypothetical protein